MIKKDSRNIRSTYGIIINKTGSKLNLPNNLDRTYCRDFLDNTYHCHYRNNCGFKHAMFSKDLLLPKLLKSTSGSKRQQACLLIKSHVRKPTINRV